jgi:hypothetical protein
MAVGVASETEVGVGVGVSVGVAVAVGTCVGASERTADRDLAGAEVALGTADVAALTHAVRRSGTTRDIARTRSDPENVRPR